MPSFGERFGNLIRQKREARGMSYAELAIAAYGDDGQGGESRKSDVLKLEKGASKKPNARTVKRFQDALGLTQAQVDACRSPQELELAQYADALLVAIKGAVAQTRVSDDLAAELSQRYAEGNPDSFEAALNGLQRALETAAEAAARDALPSNLDDAVDHILTRVNDLNAQGQIDEAAALIAEEEARAEAGLIRLWDRGIAQAILTRDADAALRYEMKKLAVEVPEAAQRFGALRAVQDIWYERGRDKGLNFDLEVSIRLATQGLITAQTADERGTLGNDLGAALQTLGARESGTARLEDAVTAYHAALEERTRDRVPLDWAMTQMNLGNALATLGERESGTAQLEDAVTAYRAALEEYTRDRVPLDWARTQMNLGTALRSLGARESGTARLKDAVTAYRAALEEYTRDRVPLQWAFVQFNLATLELAFFDKTEDPAHLDAAETYVRAAREVFEEGGASHYLGMADDQLTKIAARRTNPGD